MKSRRGSAHLEEPNVSLLGSWFFAESEGVCFVGARRRAWRRAGEERSVPLQPQPTGRWPGALCVRAKIPGRIAIRRAGRKRLATYLKNRSVKGADALADKVLVAAKAQSVTLPAEEVTARIVAELAGEVLSLKERINTLDGELRERFFARPEAQILTSLPGVGVTLGAEFLVAAGDLCAFQSADHQLAAYAGLVPAAHGSGKRVGNDRRMRGGNKAPKYVFYQSAFASLRSSPQSRAFYDRKRAEGKRHIQALIALARRRVNVLWAMLRDGTTFVARSAA